MEGMASGMASRWREWLGHSKEVGEVGGLKEGQCGCSMSGLEGGGNEAMYPRLEISLG